MCEKRVWLGVSLTLHSCECFFFATLNADVGKKKKTHSYCWERVIKFVLNAWPLKHHLPDLEMNSTVITSSTFGFAHNYTAISSFPLLAKHGNTYRIQYLYIQCTFVELCMSLFPAKVFFFHANTPWSCALPADQTRSTCYNYLHGNILDIWFYMSFELASTKAGWWFGLED